ncbi:MAG TPA: acyl-CoA dehydratase activase [Selenomonadales bacterium]|nr:acyl-CoA dehydratase activase [Selenomonadales bacterium]
MKQVVAGVDAGSTAIKIALYDGGKFGCWIRPAGWSPREESDALLRQAAQEWRLEVADLKTIVGTGYGRTSLAYVSKAMTEITCHARGAAHLVAGAATVIDIGGQDSKVIRTDEAGRVMDFLMNDKCAAGTGRFLQVMAHALGLAMADLAGMSFDGVEACRINSMCTVFAESEVIGLLNRGHSRQAIMAGLIDSIASRVAAMASRVAVAPPVVFTGGVSKIPAVAKALERELAAPVAVPEDAVYAGAIGAALFAWDCA